MRTAASNLLNLSLDSSAQGEQAVTAPCKTHFVHVSGATDLGVAILFHEQGCVHDDTM